MRGNVCLLFSVLHGSVPGYKMFFWTLQIISKFVEKVTVKKILETQPYKSWEKCKQKNWTPDRVLLSSLSGVLINNV